MVAIYSLYQLTKNGDNSGWGLYYLSILIVICITLLALAYSHNLVLKIWKCNKGIMYYIIFLSTLEVAACVVISQAGTEKWLCVISCAMAIGAVFTIKDVLKLLKTKSRINNASP